MNPRSLIDFGFLHKLMRDGLLWSEQPLRALSEIYVLKIVKNYLGFSEIPLRYDEILQKIYQRCHTNSDAMLSVPERNNKKIRISSYGKLIDIDLPNILDGTELGYGDSGAAVTPSLCRKIFEKKIELSTSYLKENEMYYEEARELLEGAIKMEQFSLNNNFEDKEFFFKCKQRLNSNEQLVQESLEVLGVLKDQQRPDAQIFEEQWASDVKQLGERIARNGLRFTERPEIEKIILCINWLDKIKTMAIINHLSQNAHDAVTETYGNLTNEEFVRGREFWITNGLTHAPLSELKLLTHERYLTKKILRIFPQLHAIFLELTKVYYNRECQALIFNTNRVSVSTLLSLTRRQYNFSEVLGNEFQEELSTLTRRMKHFVDLVKKLRQPGGPMTFDQFSALINEIYG
jgi:hypothetical protein